MWASLTEELKKRIDDGTYPPDGRLPAEMDIVAEFGCSRASARRAIEELRKQGLVETVKGKGSYVVPPGERQPHE